MLPDNPVFNVLQYLTSQLKPEFKELNGSVQGSGSLEITLKPLTEESPLVLCVGCVFWLGAP